MWPTRANSTCGVDLENCCASERNQVNFLDALVIGVRKLFDLKPECVQRRSTDSRQSQHSSALRLNRWRLVRQVFPEQSYLECGDLSPLWSVATCRDFDSLELYLGSRRQAAEGQSGDRSPHSELTPQFLLQFLNLSTISSCSACLPSFTIRFPPTTTSFTADLDNEKTMVESRSSSTRRRLKDRLDQR